MAVTLLERPLRDASAGRSATDDTSLLPTKLARARPLFDPEIVGRAIAGVVRQAQSA